MAGGDLMNAGRVAFRKVIGKCLYVLTAITGGSALTC
jgi:hypothetical protein